MRCYYKSYGTLSIKMSMSLSSKLKEFLAKKLDANMAEFVLCTRRSSHDMDEVDAVSIPIGFNMAEMNHIANELVCVASDYGITQKPFRRNVINTYVDDMVLNLNMLDDVSTVRSRNMIRYEANNDWLLVLYKNTMLPLHVFPSKKIVNDYVDIKRTTFKINSSCFINFESAQYEDGEVHNTVYININDLNHLQEDTIGTIAKIMEKLSETKLAPIF